MQEKLNEVCEKLVDAGFDAKVFSSGIGIRVSVGDERFQWDRLVSRSSLGPVADGGASSVLNFARGFEFSPGSEGYCLLSSSMKGDEDADFFCDLFMRPRGACGKIVGPRAVSAGLQMAMAA